MAFGIVELFKISVPILLIGVVYLNVSPHFPITVRESTNNEHGVVRLQHLSPQTIDFLDKTCNSPPTIVAVDEGTLVNGDFSLRKVIIVTRHGDRGPLRDVVNSTKVDCSHSTLHYHRKQIKQFLGFFHKYGRQFLEKNGENLKRIRGSNLDSLLDLPDEAGCRQGMLTQVGVAQHIRLGEEFARVYGQRLDLNSESIRWKMRVNVTPYPRTYQSALSFLYGIAQSLEIDLKLHSPRFFFGKEHGYFCGIDAKDQEDYCHQKCENYPKYREKVTLVKLFNDKTVTRMNRLRHKLRKSFADTKIQENIFRNNRHILDAINLFYCHGFPLPDTLSMKGVVELVTNVKEIISASHSNPYHQKSAFLTTYGMLLDLFKAIGTSDKSRGKEVKVELYSGHDITLEALNTVFSFSNEPAIPPYASRLILEIYKQFSSGRMFVKFIYNGHDLTANVNAAIITNPVVKSFVGPLSSEEAHFDFVEVEKVQKYLTGLLLHHFNSLDFDGVCDYQSVDFAPDGSGIGRVKAHFGANRGEADPNDQNDDQNDGPTVL